MVISSQFRYSIGVKDPNVDFKNTFLSTYNFLNNINKFLNKNTKIIFASSSAIYGSVRSMYTRIHLH